MHANAKKRQQVLEVLYQARETQASSKIKDDWTTEADLNNAVGEIDFAVSVLIEIGQVKRDGYRLRITGTGVLACEAGHGCVTFDDTKVKKALQDLQRAVGDLSPAFREIGEALVKSSKKRFETGTGPDGQRWPANSQATYEAYLHRKSIGDSGESKKGYYLKDGRASKRSAGVISGKRPLVDEGTLMDQIDSRLVGNDALEIYSTMEYAAMQQFGGTKAEFPQLWADIPARPFLGVSDEDEDAILQEIRKHLENAF